jgi:hypothetical protein
MTYIISQPETLQGYAILKEQRSLLTRFIQWATAEDVKHHIAWVGASVTCMTAVFFPLTMSVILVNGAAFGLIITAMVSLVLVVTANLAAMPTRYTIPLLFLGILIDLCAITLSFFIK